jgi:RND family efflux transporter MFP subunit
MNTISRCGALKPPLLLFLVGLTLMGCGKREEQEHAGMASEFPVSVTVVQLQRLENALSLVGTINANTDINVVSETQGAVVGVFVKTGATVKAGTVLVQIDDEIPRSTKAAADINFEKAQRDYRRTEELYQENSISVSQLDASRMAMKAAENQLDIARRQLENTSIKSPIAGTVNARYVDVGTMVSPGKSVANIVDISILKVRVNVPEREAFQLKPGDVVEISTDVHPGVTFTGKVDNIAAKADEAHTYLVEIVVPNSVKNPMKAGMFARVGFTTVAASAVPAIPRAALIGSSRDAQVFVVRGGVAYLQPLVVGRQSADLFEVASGLSEGDTVVTSGQNNLADRARVKIVEQSSEQGEGHMP